MSRGGFDSYPMAAAPISAAASPMFWRKGTVVYRSDPANYLPYSSYSIPDLTQLNYTNLDLSQPNYGYSNPKLCDSVSDPTELQ